jgi:hypothetical protein
MLWAAAARLQSMTNSDRARLRALDAGGPAGARPVKSNRVGLDASQACWASSQRSASIAAMQPEPAAVIACR